MISQQDPLLMQRAHHKYCREFLFPRVAHLLRGADRALIRQSGPVGRNRRRLDELRPRHSTEVFMPILLWLLGVPVSLILVLMLLGGL